VKGWDGGRAVLSDMGAIKSVAEGKPDAKSWQSRGCAGLWPRTGGAPLSAGGVRLGWGYGIAEWVVVCKKVLFAEMLLQG
jgi:hypothetical protein